MEAWAHGVDVTDALGRTPAASERLRHVAHLGVVTSGWSYAVRGRSRRAADVHVVLVSPAGETWTWGDPALADRIEGPALDFCLAVTQRRPLADLALSSPPATPPRTGWRWPRPSPARPPSTTRATLMLRRHDVVPASALAIAAHPDDVEFGAGGTLARWAAAGCVVHHLVLTDGSKGTWDVDADVAALVATRQDEQRAAAPASVRPARCGSSIGSTASSRPTGPRATRSPACIRELRPEVVLGHDPWRRYRLHPDHRAAGFLTTDGVVAAREPHAAPRRGRAATWPPGVRRPCCCGRPTSPTSPSTSPASPTPSSRPCWPTPPSTSRPWPSPADAQDAADETARFRRRVLEKLATWGTEIGAAHAEAFKLVDRALIRPGRQIPARSSGVSTSQPRSGSWTTTTGRPRRSASARWAAKEPGP